VRIISAIARLLVILLWTFGCQGVRLAGGLITRGDERRDRQWRTRMFQRWAAGVCRIAGLRVRGEGPRPEPPCLLVSNHLSYWDILVLAQQTGFVFAAMANIAAWPVMGAIARSLYVVFVDRTDKSKTAEVLPAIQRALEFGDGLVVFPEGGISRGIDVNPFRSPLVEPALSLGRPVATATIHYETAPSSPPASRIFGWWRPESLHMHFLRSLAHPGGTATVRYGRVDIAGLDRKRLAAALHDEVKRNFTPHW
jgi:1-acyl-sn-glycerol-3-phosphate acyltransferase